MKIHIRNTPHATGLGFTIVELLIVIVVIAILAAIVVVAYNGVQTKTMNTAKVAELESWSKQYEVYKAINGSYPAMPDGGYCLGTGFPDTSGDGIGDCRDLHNPPTRYSENTTLSSLLSSVGTLPSGPRDAVGGTIGPYVEYNSTTIRLMAVIRGSPSDCPNGTSYVWDDGMGKLLCTITLTR